MSIQFNNRIKRQIPNNIKEKYPNFVTFIEAYYSWMEQPDNPYYHLRNHLSYLDFEKSLDDYISLLKNEYLFSLPQDILASKELFIKYSKQFNLSVGTKESFQFLFNILYKENIELYYPKTDILRASDGEWVQSEVVLFLTDIENPENYINQKIVQYNNGNLQASAVIENIKRRFVKKYQISELTISRIKGEFLRDIPITVENNGGFEEYIMPVGLSYEIQNAGQNYRQGDVLTIPAGEVFEKTGNATQNGEFDVKISSSLMVSDIDLYINNNFIDPNLYDFDGQVIYYNNIVIGDSVRVEMPIYQGFIIVDTVNDNGEIQKIKVLETPIGVNGSPILLEANDGGIGAEIYLSYSPIRESEGYFRNRNGWLSSDKVLQDSNYYQEFSYVIKTAKDIEKYRDIVMDVLHPAGMKMFGQINILSLLNAMITDHSLDIEQFIPADITSSNIVSLGPTYSFFDKAKFFIDDELASIDDYADIDPTNFDFINNKGRFNFADFKQSIQPCVDDYSETDIYEFGYVCEAPGDTSYGEGGGTPPVCVDNYADAGYYQAGYICDQ